MYMPSKPSMTFIVTICRPRCITLRVISYMMCNVSTDHTYGLIGSRCRRTMRYTFCIRRLANCRTVQCTSGIHVTKYDLHPVSNSRGTGWFSELPLVTKFTVTTLLRGRVQAVLCNTIWSTYFCYRATSVVN